MIKANNGQLLCGCKTDNFRYSCCEICGAELERCKDCLKVKASDCEHYDPQQNKTNQ